MRSRSFLREFLLSEDRDAESVAWRQQRKRFGLKASNSPSFRRLVSSAVDGLVLCSAAFELPAEVGAFERAILESEDLAGVITLCVRGVNCFLARRNIPVDDAFISLRVSDALEDPEVRARYKLRADREGDKRRRTHRSTGPRRAACYLLAAILAVAPSWVIRRAARQRGSR